jgi:hypothetical protein
MITVRIAKDEITPDLRRLLKSVTPGGPLGKVLGRACANELRRHFRTLNSQRANKLGGKRTNFYSRVAEAVQNPQPRAGGISVAISHPHIAQRLYGGTITPRKKKALAIPVHKSAHGVMARIYPGTLAFIPAKGGTTKGYLVQGIEVPIKRGKRKGGKRIVPKPGGAMIYVLKGAITQRADKTVLPPTAKMAEALTRAARLVRP